MKLTVYDKDKKPLYTGTKQACLNYIRMNRLSRKYITIGASPAKVKPDVYVDDVPPWVLDNFTGINTPDPSEEEPDYLTTAFEQPKGIFKRLFSSEK